MTFPRDYPYQPPTFQFSTSGLYHPNIYPNGTLCISILHKPGEDEMSGEQASERWSPLQGVESVLRSVLLLLDDPEIGSPANVDAGVTYRDRREQYDRRARDVAEKSKNDIPPGVHFPTPEELAAVPKSHNMMDDDDDFWNETDEEDFEFDDSDTDGSEVADHEDEDDAETKRV